MYPALQDMPLLSEYTCYQGLQDRSPDTLFWGKLRNFILSNTAFERLYLQMQSVPFSSFEDQVSWKNEETIKTVLKISER